MLNSLNHLKIKYRSKTEGCCHRQASMQKSLKKPRNLREALTGSFWSIKTWLDTSKLTPTIHLFYLVAILIPYFADLSHLCASGKRQRACKRCKTEPLSKNHFASLYLQIRLNLKELFSKLWRVFLNSNHQRTSEV